MSFIFNRFIYHFLSDIQLDAYMKATHIGYPNVIIRFFYYLFLSAKRKCEVSAIEEKYEKCGKDKKKVLGTNKEKLTCHTREKYTFDAYKVKRYNFASYIQNIMHIKLKCAHINCKHVSIAPIHIHSKANEKWKGKRKGKRLQTEYSQSIQNSSEQHRGVEFKHDQTDR